MSNIFTSILKRNFVLVLLFTLGLGTTKAASGVAINPEEGEVGSLETFILTFENYSYVEYSYDGYAGPATLINNSTNESTNATVGYGSTLNKIKVSLPKKVTTPGSYTLHIPSGKLYNGYDEDEDLPEYNFNYTITEGGGSSEDTESVTANPASGSTVSSLSSILLTFDFDGEVYEGDDVTINVINDATNAVVTSCEADAMLAIYDNQMYIYLDEDITEEGNYTINFPAGAFILGDISSTDSKPFSLHYTIKAQSAIDNINADSSIPANKKGVYDIYGRKVANPINGSFYIIDGKKVIYKK